MTIWFCLTFSAMLLVACSSRTRSCTKLTWSSTASMSSIKLANSGWSCASLAGRRDSTWRAASASCNWLSMQSDSSSSTSPKSSWAETTSLTPKSRSRASRLLSTELVCTNTRPRSLLSASSNSSQASLIACKITAKLSNAPAACPWRTNLLCAISKACGAGLGSSDKTMPRPTTNTTRLACLRPCSMPKKVIAK